MNRCCKWNVGVMFISAFFCLQKVNVGAHPKDELSPRRLDYGVHKQQISDSVWGANYDAKNYLQSMFDRDQSHADCGTAIAVCQENYTSTFSSTGPGSINDLNDGTCMLGGEHESTWYIFTSQNSGSFGFIIRTAHDYDWALFDITETSCENIRNMVPVRCNYSGAFDSTGMDANAVSATVPMNFDAHANPVMPGLNVAAGHTYVLLVDNFTNDSIGYSVQFQGTASIYDTTAPTAVSAKLHCAESEFELTFSEPVKCADMLTNYFSVSRNNTTPVPIVAASGIGCSASNLLCTQVALKFDVSTVLQDGTYFISATAIHDKCGNAATASTVTTEFAAPSLPTYSGSISCGINVLHVTFSKAVWCSSVQANDFAVSGGLSVLSATPVGCNLSGKTTAVDVVFSNPSDSGTYIFRLKDTLFSADCAPVYALDTGIIYTYHFIPTPPMQLSFVNKNVKCYGEKNGAIEVAATGGTPPYHYSIVNEENNRNGVFQNLYAGIYSVSATDSSNCTVSATTTISQPDSIKIFVQPTDSLIIGLEETQAVTLSSNAANVTYRWSPLTGIDCADCSFNTISTSKDITYTVVVATDSCSAGATIKVRVVPDYNVYIPNGFSPDGDGVNDYFELFFGKPKLVKMLDFTVFDRWGEKVFESRDIHFKWNGIYNGTKLNAGVYVYLLNVVFIDNYANSNLKGTITLVK